MAGNRVKFWLTIACLAPAIWAQPQTRPIKRPLNNQLAIEGPDAPVGRVEPPAAVTGVTNQLVFHVSPLSSKGLLSQQVEDALKALDKANGNATFLKLRAFVAGGDLRRVQAIVTELFTEKKWPLPALTTVQVGSLLQEGSQVVIESVSEEKRAVSSGGLGFIPAVTGASGAEAVSALAKAFGASAPLRVTCFAESQAEAEAARTSATKQFPKAVGVFVQTTRYTLGTRVECEGVGAGGPINDTKLMFAGTQITFGETDEDVKLAFDRLEKAVAPLGASTSKAALMNVYATSRALTDKARGLAIQSTTALFIEGLPAADATVAVEAVIPVP